MPNEPSFMTFFHLPSEFNHVLFELWINHLSWSKVTTDSVNWSRTHPLRWLPPLTGCNRRDVRLGARDPPHHTTLHAQMVCDDFLDMTPKAFKEYQKHFHEGKQTNKLDLIKI